MIKPFLKQFGFVNSLLQLRAVLNRSDQWRCGLIVVMTIVGAGLDLLLVGIIPATVKLLADPVQINGVPVINRILPDLASISQFGLLKTATLALVILGGGKLTYFVCMHWFILKTGRSIRVRLSRELLQAYLAGSWNFHVATSKAELLRNLSADLRDLVVGVVQPLVTALYGLLMTVLVAVVLFMTLPTQVILVFLLTAAAAGSVLGGLSRYLRRHGENAKVQNKVVLKEATEALAHFIEVQLSGRYEWFLRRFSKGVLELSRSQDRMAFVSRVLPVGLEVVSLVGVMALVILMTSSAGSVTVVLPEVAMIGVGAVRLRQSIAQFTSSLAQVQFSIPSLEHIHDHLNRLRGDSRRMQQPQEKMKLAHQIELEKVSFSYPGREEKTLADLSLVIRRGQNFAFIGETGCGKSTLLRLLLGVVEPTGGAMLVDGRNVQENVRGWQANIGYVPQSTCLLDASIRENIALGTEFEDIDAERLEVAIETAKLREVVGSGLGGLDQMVGENGSKLSGGQRQRIGIARAVYERPEVILLDESTSALDQQTEQAVLRELIGLPWNPTLLFVTHRLKAIEAFDQVVELEQGRHTVLRKDQGEPV